MISQSLGTRTDDRDAAVSEEAINELFQRTSPQSRVLPVHLTHEQEERLLRAATEEEAITLLKGWGYEFVRS